MLDAASIFLLRVFCRLAERRGAWRSIAGTFETRLHALPTLTRSSTHPTIETERLGQHAVLPYCTLILKPLEEVADIRGRGMSKDHLTQPFSIIESLLLSKRIHNPTHHFPSPHQSCRNKSTTRIIYSPAYRAQLLFTLQRISVRINFPLSAYCLSNRPNPRLVRGL